MLKIKSLGLICVAVLIIAALSWAAPPQDYKLGYVFKNSAGSVFRIIRYYLRDGNKYRKENLTTVQLQTNNTAAHVEQLPADTKPQTIQILRRDKGLVWSLDPSFKVYFQVPLRQDDWDNAIDQNFIADFSMVKKTGDTELFHYPCDIYQTEAQDGWSSIITVARGFNVVLKHELFQNGKLVQTTEALEFSREKPAAALFEIPAGYKKQ